MRCSGEPHADFSFSLHRRVREGAWLHRSEPEKLDRTHQSRLKQSEGQVYNLPNYFVHLNSYSSDFSELRIQTHGLIPSRESASILELGFSCCPTSGSISPAHVDRCWELDTTENRCILNLWPFLLPFSSSPFHRVSPSFLLIPPP